MNCYGNYLQYCDVRKSAYCSSVVYIYCNGRLSSHFWMKNVHRIENAHIFEKYFKYICFAYPRVKIRTLLRWGENWLFVCLVVCYFTSPRECCAHKETSLGRPMLGPLGFKDNRDCYFVTQAETFISTSETVSEVSS